MSSILVLLPEYQEPNALRLSPYFRIDFSAEYHWWSTSNTLYQLNLGLLNLTNQEYILGRRFRGGLNSAGSLELSTIDTFSQGFTPNIAFKIGW